MSIVTRELLHRHRFGRKLVPTAIALAGIAGTIMFGLVNDSPKQVRVESQENDRGRPAFEVASIRLDKSSSPLPGAHLFGDRFNATITAYGLVALAYKMGLSSNQISGGPAWIKSQLFDINAKVEDSVTDGKWKKLSLNQQWSQVQLMVQSLLADRFKLKVNRETKELPVYALVVARNGPKFVEDSAHPEIDAISARGRGKVEAISSRVGNLVWFLSIQPELEGRLVVDKTELRSYYSFTLQWAPETLSASSGQSANSEPFDSSRPPLFVAIQEQLGLKLEPAKGPVEVLVIDHVERPSEN